MSTATRRRAIVGEGEGGMAGGPGGGGGGGGGGGFSLKDYVWQILKGPQKKGNE